MRRFFAALLLAAVFAVPFSAQAQPAADEKPSVLPRHHIALDIGLLPQAAAEPGDARLSGYLGALTYAYRMAPGWTLEAGGAVHSTEAQFAETATVTSLLFGTNYYPAALAPSPTVRPYLTGALGPYIGASASGLRGQTRTQTVVGARFGAGLDVRFSTWLTGGLRAAYHAAPDYADTVGSARSPRGARLSLRLGVTFGRP